MTIDIPTALTRMETDLLHGICRDGKVVEGGSLLGYSTVAIAQVAKQVVSIDPHTGYCGRDTLATYMSNIRRYGVAGRVTTVVGEVQKANLHYSPDVVFLDLTGEYDLTKESITAAHSSGAKRIAVHDYARGGCHGATKAVDEAVRKFGWRVMRKDTLVVLEVGDAISI